MKLVCIIKIFFILSICLEPLWATTHGPEQNIDQHIDQLAPMRNQLPSVLTPRRPLRFCAEGSPSDLPQVRPPLDVRDPLRLRGEGDPSVPRLGSNPPLRIQNRPSRNLECIDGSDREPPITPLRVGGGGGVWGVGTACVRGGAWARCACARPGSPEARR